MVALVTKHDIYIQREKGKMRQSAGGGEGAFLFERDSENGNSVCEYECVCVCEYECVSECVCVSV